MAIISRTLKPDKLNHLAALRENAGLNRKEAAAKLDCTEACLCQLEKKFEKKIVPGADEPRKRKPSINMAQKMCEEYKCTLEDIFPTIKSKAV